MIDFTIQHNLICSVNKLMWMLMNTQNNKFSDNKQTIDLDIRLTGYKIN